MTFDGEGVLGVLLQPLRLTVERRNRLRAELRRIGLEEHAVADIDHEILLAAGRRAARGKRPVVGLIARAAGRGQRERQESRDLCSTNDTYNTHHSGALLNRPVTGHVAGLAGAWLNESSSQP